MFKNFVTNTFSIMILAVYPALGSKIQQFLQQRLNICNIVYISSFRSSINFLDSCTEHLIVSGAREFCARGRLAVLIKQHSITFMSHHKC